MTHSYTHAQKHVFDYLHTLENDWPLIQHLKSYKKTLDSLSSTSSRFSKFDDVVILGTGGSSLGGQALTALKSIKKVEQKSPNIHFVDNIDSCIFLNILDTLNPKTTGVIAISKSGNTAETLMQILTLIEAWQSCEEFTTTDNMCIISEPNANALQEVACQFFIPTLVHPTDVGGRFSVFTAVGLLPGLLAGLDMEKFCDGALSAFYECMQQPIDQSTPLLAAMTHDGFLKEGINQFVLFAYSNNLIKFCDWFCQLWGESLGKKRSDGEIFGTTPIRSIGATDQHSQLQLYLDGPRDKHFRFFVLENQVHLSPVQSIILHPACKALLGKNMGQLMTAEQKATIDTLRASNKPVSVIQIENLDEHTMGVLMMHSMLETLATASIWGINPFDQPAVEDGKKRAIKYLNNLD